jgi:hypothetical protein
MFLITVPADCEITLTGMPLDPAEHPITIKNGVNWIGYPLNQNMTPADAFAGFAVSGYMLKTKANTAQSTTYNGTRWRGTLSNLVPGQGYIYKSSATGDRVFVFPLNSK